MTVMPQLNGRHIGPQRRMQLAAHRSLCITAHCDPSSKKPRIAVHLEMTRAFPEDPWLNLYYITGSNENIIIPKTPSDVSARDGALRLEHITLVTLVSAENALSKKTPIGTACSWSSSRSN